MKYYSRPSSISSGSQRGTRIRVDSVDNTQGENDLNEQLMSAAGSVEAGTSSPTVADAAHSDDDDEVLNVKGEKRRPSGVLHVFGAVFTLLYHIHVHYCGNHYCHVRVIVLGWDSVRCRCCSCTCLGLTVRW